MKMTLFLTFRYLSGILPVFEMQMTSAIDLEATWSDFDDFTYSYSDSSIANIYTSGNSKALKPGTVTVTIKHKITGVSTTCTVRCVDKIILEKEDTDTQIGELFFTIESQASSGTYLMATYGNGRSVSCITQTEPQKNGRFIWRLKQDSNGYYQFISLSNYRTINGVYSEACLESWLDVGTEAINVSEYKQQWVVEKVSGGYYIINHYNNKYLTRNGNSLTITASPTSASLWTIEGISANQFESYFGGSISDEAYDSAAGILHVWIDIDDVVVEEYSNVTKEDIRNWASEWNGVYSNIVVHTNSQKPSYIDKLYIIRITSIDFVSLFEREYAYTAVNGMDMPQSLTDLAEQSTLDNVDWKSATIWMNTAFDGGNQTPILPAELFKIVLLHEMGHALKLKHPNETGAYANIQNSIMISGGTQATVPNEITDFDRMLLLSKWKYHDNSLGLLKMYRQ